MYEKLKTLAPAIAVMVGLGVAVAHAEATPEPGELTVSGRYGPSPAFPFGRPHPEAPRQLDEFAFFVGEFACRDRTRQRDGSWSEFPAIWNGAYFLNGFGIQDKYWSPARYTSNIRIFDAASGEWKVTYFSAPRYFSGVWSGGKQGDDMVLLRETGLAEGKVRVSRLTFFDITDNGFEWKSETATDGDFVSGWTSSCKRRR